jgi:glycosyltransferase involved in cell wall biosynthesis
MKEKLKIAFLNPSASIGGAELSLIELLKNTKDFYNYLVLLPGKGELSDKLSSLKINYEIVGWGKSLLNLGERNKSIQFIRIILSYFYARLLALKIARILSSAGISILITNGIKAHIIGSMIKQKYDCRLIWYIREIFDDRKLSRMILKYYQKNIDSAIVVSNSVKKSCSGFLSKKTDLLYNIIDFDLYDNPVPPPEDLHKKGNEVWFCVIGAITELKGQHLFLQAAEKVLSENINCRFFIVGDNQYHSEKNSGYTELLKNIVASSALLTDRAHFLGRRNEITEILSVMDILVQPNTGPEGFGRSVAEAMASHKAVIVVDRWGPAELVKDRFNGLTFIHNDLNSLIEKMKLLTNDRKLMEDLGSEGYSFIKKLLDKEAILNKYFSIINNFPQSRQSN